MSATNFGFIWGTSGSVDSTLNGTTLFPATGTGGATAGPSAAIQTGAASPNEQAAIKIELVIGFSGTIAGGAPTIYVCQESNSTFETVSGTGSVSTVGNPFAFTGPTPIASTSVPVQPIVIQAADANQVKVYVYNPSGNSSITVAMTIRTCNGAIG